MKPRTVEAQFAVVLGLSPTGLYVLRELGRAQVPCAGVADGIQCGEASAYLTAASPIRYMGDSRTLVSQLRALAAQREERGLLIPTSDTFIDFISSNLPVLTEDFEVHDCYEKEFVDLVLDKARFLERCREAKVATPRFRDVRPEDLGEAANSLSYPLIIKPALIHQVKDFMAGRKVFIANDKAEFNILVSQIPRDAETTWLVQEIISGPDSNIVLFSAYRDRKGKVHQAFTARKLRQFPPGFGSASLVVSENLPEVREAAERLLAGLNFHGIAGIEMKNDSRDGILKIIEMNLRPSLWFAASTAAGKRASLAAFCELSRAEMPEEVPQEHPVIWRYALKDLYSAFWYKFRSRNFVLPSPTIGDIFDVATCRRVGAVYAPDDPAPVVRELQNYAKKSWRRLIKPRAS